MINLRSTNSKFNPKIPPVEERPKCEHTGCSKKKAIISTNKDGEPRYRAVCSFHHSAAIAERHGVKRSSHLTAQRQNLSIQEYRNKFHRYRKHRKEFCENKDSRLGFKCTTTIVWKGMLDVDHVNGDPKDNRPENLQTLCKCCHSYKTMVFGDWQSPGRNKN